MVRFIVTSIEAGTVGNKVTRIFFVFFKFFFRETDAFDGRRGAAWEYATLTLPVASSSPCPRTVRGSARIKTLPRIPVKRLLKTIKTA